MITLFTKRLKLRPPVAADVDAITALLQERRVVEMLSVVPWPYEHHHARTWLEEIEARQADGHWDLFSIVLRETDEMIGTISLTSAANGFWGVFGYWLGIDFWGRGYMTEALREILRHGFEDLKLRRIEACHFAHNPASGRVMAKAGLTCEGVQRLRAARFDELYDRVNYGIIDEDWRALSGTTG
ncbi:GNAT family N-acetyltransferase [Haloferula sargassicola]|uniref:N-acetyltransferase domain-containing protein n=1 Tax=Haloferula sargassicola TaxID=490096 RepID=A0ABP9UK25_9BACT